MSRSRKRKGFKGSKFFSTMKKGTRKFSTTLALFFEIFDDDAFPFFPSTISLSTKILSNAHTHNQVNCTSCNEIWHHVIWML